MKLPFTSFRITIGKKIFFGIGSVIFLILIQAVVGNLGFNNVETQFFHYRNTNSNVLKIHDMQENLLDHQRGVLAYTYSGYKGLSERVNLLEKSLEKQIQEAENDSKITTNKEILQKMQQQLKQYGEYFKQAVVERQARDKLAYNDLIEKGNEVFNRLEQLRLKLIRHKKYLEAGFSSVAQTQLALIQRDVLHFLLKPSSNLVRATQAHLEKLQNSLSQLSENLTGKYIERSETELFPQLIQLSKDFERCHNGMVQASRAYLHLVYVVMGGEAARITYLANKLKDNSLEKQTDVENKVRNTVNNTRQLIFAVSVLTIALGIFLAWRISRNISQPIESMTHALSSLARGNMDMEIPGKGRSDEIGAMSMAADVFREKAFELDNASRYKSEFLANMSHELRTPLNSMLILSKTLANNDKKRLNKDEVESAQVIHDSGVDLLRLINDILDLSKVEAGRMDVYIEEKKLLDFKETIKRMFLPIARRKNLDFDIVIGENTPDELFTDWGKVEQIIRNFLSNAFKFTAQGYVKVHLGRTDANQLFINTALSGQNSLCISVKDSGIGIAKDKYEQIFEAFRQVDGTTSRKYGGTGLGLNISRRFAQLLGGEIQVKSTLGEGSDFSLYLPLKLPEQLSAKDKNRASSQAASQQLTNRKLAEFKDLSRTILLVDDDHRNIFALKQILSKRVGRILSAYNGLEAIKILNEHPDVDLVFMDIMMPIMNGYQAMNEIRKQPRFSKLPIVALTAKAMRGDREKCLKAGASEYLAKPVDTEQLLYTLQDWLAKPNTGMKQIRANEKEKPEDFPKLKILKQNGSENDLDSKLVQALNTEPVIVLIADDDMRNTFSLARILQKLTEKILIARDGEKALEQLKVEQNVDIILMDIMMPNMNGYDAIRAIRDDEKLKDIPVIALTALTHQDEKQQCLDAGADDYLSKPVDLEILLDKMRYWIAAGKTRQQNNELTDKDPA